MPTLTRTARRPYLWLTAAIGLCAALMWTSLALRAIVMDKDPSSKALFACTALVLAGFALGSATWILTAPRRAKRPADALMPEETKALFAMMGIMLIGLGADPILDTSTSAWDWLSLVFASLVGGVHLGIAFMGTAGQSADAGPESTGLPSRPSPPL